MLIGFNSEKHALGTVEQPDIGYGHKSSTLIARQSKYRLKKSM